MIPVRLALQGFLSYLEPVEIDFTSIDLACISGHNGAGKSSLLDAMTWVLFGQARRRDDAVINSKTSPNQKDHKGAEVCLDFDYEGNRYRVQRSKVRNQPAVLEFYIQDEQSGWRPLTEHSLRETEERIQQILRMDYETFTNASFFLQGKADQFAQQRPSDRKRILSNVLGLESWELYREKTLERRRKAEKDLASLEGQLREVEAELAQEGERREKLKQFEQELERLSTLRKSEEQALGLARDLESRISQNRSLIDSQKTQLAAAETRLRNNSKHLDELQAEAATYEDLIASAGEIEAGFSAWQQAAAELEQWAQLAGQFQTRRQERNAPLMQIETGRTRLEEEQRHLCQQQQRLEEQQKLLPELQARLDQAEQATLGLQEQLEEREALGLQRQAVTDEINERSAENKHLKEEMNDLKERLEQLQAAETEECPLCGQPLGLDERLNLITSLQAEGESQGKRFRENKKAIEDLQEQKAALEKSLAALAGLEKSILQNQQSALKLQSQRDGIQQALTAWEKDGAQRLAEVEHQLAQGAFAEQARAELERIDAAIAAIGYDPAAHQAAQQAEIATRANQERRNQLEKARAALDPIQREVRALQAGMEKDQADLQNQQKAYREMLAQFDTLAGNLPDVKSLDKQVLQRKAEENRLRMQVGAARQNVEVLAARKEQRKQYTEQIETCRQLIARYQQLERAFGKDGVPALLIEQALPEIERQANDLLDRLTDGSMSVRFDTQRDYKDKKREDKKETLDIIITDSAGSREYEMFSGGEAFRVNFAIRLALSRVLAHRAGARLQTLVIDEGFGSQDAEGRQRLVEAINRVRGDFAKILVITHLEELQDQFPAHIEVEKTRNGSSVQVIVA